MARLTGSLNVQGSIDASSITGSLDWDTLVNVPAGIMSSSTGFIEASQTASMTVGTANTASYVTSSNVDGEENVILHMGDFQLVDGLVGRIIVYENQRPNSNN